MDTTEAEAANWQNAMTPAFPSRRALLLLVLATAALTWALLQACPAPPVLNITVKAPAADTPAAQLAQKQIAALAARPVPAAFVASQDRRAFHRPNCRWWTGKSLSNGRTRALKRPASGKRGVRTKTPRFGSTTTTGSTRALWFQRLRAM